MLLPEGDRGRVLTGRRFEKCVPDHWAREAIMLWTIIGVLLILWLLGFGFSIGGSLIHLLLVVALIVFVINLVSNRRVV
jgi:hypothetical protein